MKKFACIVVGLTVALVGCTCSAQENAIPFERLQHDAELKTHSMTDGVDANSSSSSAAASSTAGSLYSRLSPPAVRPALNKSYFLLNGLNLGMTLADMEMMQHCIADHLCEEGNPMMPSSQAGQISIGIGIFTYAAGSNYWLKRRKSKIWAVPPTVGIVTHVIGVASGLRFR